MKSGLDAKPLFLQVDVLKLFYKLPALIVFIPHPFFVPSAIPVFIFDTYVESLDNAACPRSVYFFKLSSLSNFIHFWPCIFISDNMLRRLTQLHFQECKCRRLSDEFFHLMGHQDATFIPFPDICLQ